MNQRRGYKSLFLSLFLVSGVCFALLLVWWNQQAIHDWWRLRGYDPPVEIVQLVDATTMSDASRHLFYVQHPRIEPSEDFNKHCNIGEFTIVLGCYVSGQGIYIFRVDDERLSGIEEVTAAHEMLHVAYERLSVSEKKRVDALTAKAFEQADNQRIRDNIEQYRKQDPAVVPNELHSILGTEVRDLPAELEAYYKQYFVDREAVVAFSEQYEAAFNARKVEADNYAAQIKALKETIDADNTALQIQGRTLEAEYQALERLRPNAQPSSFNARVAAYNAELERYNQAVRQVSALIDKHNALIEQYNEVVLEHQDLIRAINSRPETLAPQ